MKKHYISKISTLLILIITLLIAGCSKGPSKSEIETAVKSLWSKSPARDLLIIRGRDGEFQGFNGLSSSPWTKYQPSDTYPPTVTSVEVTEWGDISENGDKQKVMLKIDGSVRVFTNESTGSGILSFKFVDKGTENFSVVYSYTMVKDEYGKWSANRNK